MSVRIVRIVRSRSVRAADPEIPLSVICQVVLKSRVTRDRPDRHGTADALSGRRHGGPLSDLAPSGRATGHETGFSLPELLAVLAMLAIAIAIGIPLVNEQVRIAEVRAAADDFALHLRAARMISVTQHRTVRFQVYVDPNNSFEYERFESKWKRVFLPDRVRIVPESDRMISFKQNGSVEVASTIILEADVSGARERWTASVNTVGVTTLTHERVN